MAGEIRDGEDKEIHLSGLKELFMEHIGHILQHVTNVNYRLLCCSMICNHGFLKESIRTKNRLDKQTAITERIKNCLVDSVKKHFSELDHHGVKHAIRINSEFNLLSGDDQAKLDHYKPKKGQAAPTKLPGT